MQKLHLVGFTTDLDGLILSARKGSRSGSFVLALDEALVEAMVDAVRRREDDAEGGTGAHGAARFAAAVGSGRTRPDSALSVREMQDRLRAGASIDDVAAEAGVDADWVARFAPPVQAEQARVVERARQMLFDKPRVGQSRLPLGDAVARNVLGKGVHLSEDDFDGGWSAHLLPGGLWAIRFTYVSRGREQEAMWVLDLEEDDLSAGNRLASQLGYAASARVRKAPGTRKKKAAAKKAGGRRRTAKKATARKATARKATAKKATAKKATAKKATAKKKAATRKASRKKATAKKATAKKATAKKATAKKATAKKATVRKASARKASRKTASAKKAAPEKASVKKTAAKKAAAKKTAPRRGARARTPRRSSGDRGAGGREAPPAPPPAPRFLVPATGPAPRPAPAPFRPAAPPVERRPAARPVNTPSRLVPVPPSAPPAPSPPASAPPASAPPPSAQPRMPPPPVRRPAPVIRADRAAGAPAPVEGDGATPPPVPPRRRLRRRREPLRAR